MVSWRNTNCNMYNLVSKIPIIMCYLKAFRNSMKSNPIVFSVPRLYLRLLNLYFFQTQVNNKGEKNSAWDLRSNHDHNRNGCMNFLERIKINSPN